MNFMNIPWWTKWRATEWERKTLEHRHRMAVLTMKEKGWMPGPVVRCAGTNGNGR